MTTTPEGFEALCMAMEQDAHALHGLPVEQKAAFKAERLPGYLEHVAEYENAGDVYANPVLVESMIWSADLLLDGHPAANAPLFERLALIQRCECHLRVEHHGTRTCRHLLRMLYAPGLKPNTTPTPAPNRCFLALWHSCQCGRYRKRYG